MTNTYQYCSGCERRLNVQFFLEDGNVTPHNKCCYCRGLYPDGTVIPEYEPEEEED